MHRLLVLLLMLASCARMPVPATLPPEIAAVLPATCKQVLHVTAADEQSTSAHLRMLQRTAADTWTLVGETIPVRIGRHGLAWGAGEPALPVPAGARIKKEGDGCAPIGIFRITQAFGSEVAPSGIKLPYIHCTAHHFGIDDVRSRYYNQIVDDREVACDWTSPETMIPSSGCYKLGAVIAHNPHNQPGLGSCIFLHLWQGENVPTSGCTAMSETHLREVLTWLDPAADPRLVQLVEPR
jgi:L,D-peptidoglycan transpeptidase YkuD (ErfK/YbiS/YcfS/YnhG family)